MKTVLVFSLLLACTVVHSSDLFLGNQSFDNLILVFRTQAKYRGIPFIRREKDVFYNNPRHRIIEKIVIIDFLPNSKARATVTAGGIGQSYVNIRLTSERGSGLYFDINIYSSVEPTTTEPTTKDPINVTTANAMGKN